MRRPGALALLLALAGCGWTGGAFYTGAETVAPIAAGDYQATAGDSPSRLRISILPNGLTRFGLAEGGREENLAGFAPLDADHHYYAIWLVEMDGQPAPGGELPYGILEARPDGHFRLAFPDCRGDRAEALAAGATLTNEGDAECRFHDRAALEAGLRAFTRHPGEEMELVPIPHG